MIDFQENDITMRYFLFRVIGGVFLVIVIGGCTSINKNNNQDVTRLSHSVRNGHANPISNETQILIALPDLTPNVEKHIGDVTVLVGDTYMAASGKYCKFISWSKRSESLLQKKRVACENDNGWVFVKNVLSRDSNNKR